VAQQRRSAKTRARRETVGDEIGQLRRVLYEKAIVRLDRAIHEGFWIEAIAIEESLICDRLESLVEKCADKAVNFGTLNELVKKARPYCRDSMLSVLDEVDRWRPLRNRAVHELVKVKMGTYISWSQRLRVAQLAAVQGRVLLRDVDREVLRVTRVVSRSQVGK
jgi:hypothetical protein